MAVEEEDREEEDAEAASKVEVFFSKNSLLLKVSHIPPSPPLH